MAPGATEITVTDIPGGDCQSPMARWFDSPHVAAANDAGMQHVQGSPQQNVTTAQGQMPPQAPRAAFFVMVPAPMPSFGKPLSSAVVDVAVTEHRTAASTPKSTNYARSERSSRHGDSGSSTEVGVDSEDSTEQTSTAPRLSASASRRRRRQRAAAYAKLAESGAKTGIVPNELAHLTGGTHAPSVSGAAAAASTFKMGRGIQDRTASLTTRLQQGGASLQGAVSELRGQVRRLSLHSDGCRTVQLALELAEVQDAAELVSELRGSVRRAIASPHGNYVIQKVVQVMPVAISDFVVQELVGDAVDLSQHRYGCRIVCRLLEHTADHPPTVALVDEILQATGQLSRHTYGHHVLESILEHGSARQKHHVAMTLVAELPLNLRNTHATFVLDMILKYCSAADRNVLVCALLQEQVPEGQGLQKARSQILLARRIAEKESPMDAPSTSCLITKTLQRRRLAC